MVTCGVLRKENMDIIKSKEWHEDRRKGVGGSDVASVLNLPPYGCARKLWYEKRGNEPDFEPVINPAMQRGIYLEGIVRDIYRLETKNKVEEAYAITSAASPFMLSNVDGFITDTDKHDSDIGVLEIKCPGREMYHKIKRNGIPEGYILQGQHYMSVSDIKWMHYAIFCADMWELLVVPVERDEELIKYIIEEEEEFWKHVENGPVLDRLDTGDTRCRKCDFRLTCWGELWREDDQPEGKESDYKEIDPAEAAGFVKAFDGYTEAKELVKQAEAVKEDARQDLIDKIGNDKRREKLLCSQGKTTYKWQKRSQLDREKLEARYPGAIKECTFEDGSLQLRTYPKK
jgi:putative phage-type endonuclease